LINNDSDGKIIIITKELKFAIEIFKVFLIGGHFGFKKMVESSNVLIINL